jgi:hypothetical protein
VIGAATASFAVMAKLPKVCAMRRAPHNEQTPQRLQLKTKNLSRSQQQASVGCARCRSRKRRVDPDRLD